MTRGAAIAVLAAALLAACSGERDAPGGVTADDARQLNQAAAMLDANSVDAGTLANAGDPR